MSDWVPTREAWDKFLYLLDANSEVAGARYEEIRRRLIIYFECRKCRDVEDLADETITRTIRRNDEGVKIDDVMRYCYGVARIVRQEGLTKTRRQDLFQEELLRFSNPFAALDDTDEEDARIKAFDECMEKLSAANRQFILSYYDGTGRAKIDQRKSLTEKLGISKNAVTLRAYQIRQKLEKCTKSQLKRALLSRNKSH